MPTCPGCTREFSFTGCARHLAQTRNQACREIYEELYRFEVSSDVDSDYLDRFESSNVDSDEVNPYFSGDIFEARADDIFGGSRWTDNDNQMDIDDDDNRLREEDNGESGEEDDLLSGDFEAGWEPVRLGQMADITEMEYADDTSAEDDAPQARLAVEMEHTDDMSVNDDALQAEVEPTGDISVDDHDDAPQARLEAEEQLYNEPIVMKFPYGNAGAPITNAEANGYHSYKHQMTNSESCWAPFKSKIEWEIARWAKLRGPSSTAFDDLLGIEGVSLPLLIIFMLWLI